MEDRGPGRSEQLTIVNVREITFPDIFNFGTDKVTVRVFSIIFCSENIMAIKYWFTCGAFAVRSHAVSNLVLYWKAIHSVQKELLCSWWLFSTERGGCSAHSSLTWIRRYWREFLTRGMQTWLQKTCVVLNRSPKRKYWGHVKLRIYKV